MQRTEEIKNREYREVVFTAEDGTRFVAHNCSTGYMPRQEEIDSAEKHCIEYENTCEHAVSLQFNKIAREITGSMYYCIDNILRDGCGEDIYYFVQPKNADDIATILKAFKVIGESALDYRKETKDKYYCCYADKLEVGKNYIVCYSPDCPFMSLYEAERLKEYVCKTVDAIVKGESWIAEEEEEN